MATMLVLHFECGLHDKWELIVHRCRRLVVSVLCNRVTALLSSVSLSRCSSSIEKRSGRTDRHAA